MGIRRRNQSALHYNWHRHYDPTLGRYTQTDPLGFVDGPSVFGYVRGSPAVLTDPTGEFAWLIPPAVGLGVGLALDSAMSTLKEKCGCKSSSGVPPGAYGAAGGATGLFGGFVGGKTGGLAGGGLSGYYTSSWSTMISGRFDPGTVRIYRDFGGAMARGAPIAGAAMLLSDLADLWKCSQ